MARRQLADKRIIITGASSGIGHALAIQLAAAGADLVVNARRSERLEELAREVESIGQRCCIVAGDVTDADVRSRLVDACVGRFKGCDCLINNAGIGAMGSFREADPERMRRIFEVNFFATVELTRIAIPYLAAGNDPLIVNTCSVLGHRAVPLKSEYSASKFALHGFSDALRAELANESIEVLLVSPSTVDSDFFDSAIEDPTGRNWKQRGAVDPETVARKTLGAMAKRKHELILPMTGKLLVWFDRLLPTLANHVVSRQK